MTEAERFLDDKVRRASASAVPPSPVPVEPPPTSGIGGASSRRAESRREVAVGKRKGLAIASLVCAIIGGWASTATIPAIICGHLALSRMKKNPQEFGGKGMALAGLILGYFGLGLAMLLGVTRGYTKAMIQLMTN